MRLRVRLVSQWEARLGEVRLETQGVREAWRQEGRGVGQVRAERRKGAKPKQLSVNILHTDMRIARATPDSTKPNETHKTPDSTKPKKHLT